MLSRLSRVPLKSAGSKMAAVPKLPAGRPFLHQTKRNFFMDPVFDAIQVGVTKMHNLGLPWWGAIASSTVIVRTGLLPFLYMQLVKSRGFVNVASYIQLLTMIYLRRTGALRNKMKVVPLTMDYLRGVFRAFKASGFSLRGFLIYPVTNLALFMTFVISIRKMLLVGDDSLSHGGALWFEDLTEKDETYILPITAVALTYSSLRYSFMRFGSASMFAMKLMDWIQTVVLLFLPVSSMLPAGVFCYWIPSTLFALATTFALRRPAFLKWSQSKIQPVKGLRFMGKDIPQMQWDPLLFTMGEPNVTSKVAHQIMIKYY